MRTFITKYLDDKYIILKSFETDVSDPKIVDIDLYSTVIILGGHQSIKKISEYPELLNVIKLIKICIDKSKPLLGICLGCQLIAYALGCEIRTKNYLNIGFDTKIMGCDNVFRCHYDYIVPNNIIKPIEYVDSMLYTFEFNCAYGIQCHPDISVSDMTEYQNLFPNTINIDVDKDIIDTDNKKILKTILKKIENIKHV